MSDEPRRRKLDEQIPGGWKWVAGIVGAVVATVSAAMIVGYATRLSETVANTEVSVKVIEARLNEQADTRRREWARLESTVAKHEDRITAIEAAIAGMRAASRELR